MADQEHMDRTPNSRKAGRDDRYHEEISSEPVLLLPEPDLKKEHMVNEMDHQSYRAESAAEIAAPMPVDRRIAVDRTRRGDREAGGTILGFTALAFAILSLFIMPVIFGITAIALGFLALRREAGKTGGWAIGIGAVSLIIGVFITPFF